MPFNSIDLNPGDSIILNPEIKNNQQEQSRIYKFIQTHDSPHNAFFELLMLNNSKIYHTRFQILLKDYTPKQKVLFYIVESYDLGLQFSIQSRYCLWIPPKRKHKLTSVFLPDKK